MIEEIIFKLEKIIEKFVLLNDTYKKLEKSYCNYIKNR